MRSTSLLSCLAGLVAVSTAYTTPTGDPSGNAITKPGLNEIVPAGQPYTITWDPTTQGTVSLVLLRGPSTNVVPLYAIVEGIPNGGNYSWTPSTDLEPDTTHYGLQLIVDATGQYQYSTQFGISNDAYTGNATSSSSSGSSSSSAATTSGSVIVAPSSTPTTLATSIVSASSSSTSATVVDADVSASTSSSAVSTSTGSSSAQTTSSASSSVPSSTAAAATSGASSSSSNSTITPATGAASSVSVKAGSLFLVPALFMLAALV